MLEPSLTRGFTLLVAVAVLCLVASGAAAADDSHVTPQDTTPVAADDTVDGPTNTTGPGLDGTNASTAITHEGVAASSGGIGDAGGNALGADGTGTAADIAAASSPSGIVGQVLRTQLDRAADSGTGPATEVRVALAGTAPADVGRSLVIVESPSSDLSPAAGATGPSPYDLPSGPDVPAGVGSVGTGLVVLLVSVRTVGMTASSGASPNIPGPRAVLDYLIRLGILLRYSRYDDSDPLEQETRRQVYDVVQQTPGLYLSAVAEGAGIPLSTARHHARVLEQEGLLASRKVRGKRRFYPNDEEELALVAAVDDESTASVLDALEALGEASVARLADHIDRDPSTVTHHLQRLEGEGLVVRERDGRSVRNRLAPAVRRALDQDGADPRRGVTVIADD